MAISRVYGMHYTCTFTPLAAQRQTLTAHTQYNSYNTKSQDAAQNPSLNLDVSVK